jgi:hypothetical protein
VPDAHAWITTLGAVISTGSALFGVFYAWFKRSTWKDFFRSRFDLAHDLQLERLKSADLERGKQYADQLNATLEPLVSEHRRQIDDLLAQTSVLANLKVKVDAFLDYTNLLIGHIAHLNMRISAAGIASDDIHMPSIPSALADKFNVPESLR